MAASVSTGAILFTDMVDSTALRSRLGEARADVLRRHHDELLTAAIDAHGGEVARWTGDGVKAVFPTASDAIGAAVAIQRAVVEYGQQADSVAPFQVRIGLSIGEVSTDETGDRRGVAVVEAARLEALARPGEILATDMVRLLGHRRAHVAFEDAGERTLKGIDLPVTVVRVVDTEAGAAVPLPRFLATDTRLPLVGRDHLLQTFDARWADARAGRSGVVLVRGQAGIGKTRLVSQCAATAHAAGGLVLGGWCSSDVDVPYEPVAMAFRAAAGLDAALDAALTAHAGPLARLFPAGPVGTASAAGVAGVAGVAGAGTNVADEPQLYLPRQELFDAVGDLVRRLASRQPLLLVVDDLHWATAPTVLLLRHLLTQLGDDRLLVVGTFRDGDVDPAHPLRDLLAEVRPLRTTTVLEPDVLTEVDVARLVSTVAPAASISRAALVAEAVCRETAGNPFFAAELLRHLSDTGQIEQDLTSVVPVPVADVVTQRLAQLVPGAVDLLRFAAVLGASFSVDLLAAVAGGRADDALDVLDVLEGVARAGLVRELGVDQFEFVHAIVRTALLDGMTASRKARAHRSAAEALEARGADQFDELAHHWQMAGADDHAIEYLLRAADRDMGALAFESAKARYDRVIELLNHNVRAETHTRAKAWLGLAAARRSLFDPAFKDAAVRAARLARTARDPLLMAEAATLGTWLGTNSFWVAEAPDTEMIELCEDTLGLLPERSPLRVRLLAALASHHTFSPSRERRVALIAEANRLAAELGDTQMLVDVLHAEFVCLWEPATLDRREQIARDLGRLARATGDARLSFLAGFFAAECLLERGDLDGCEARLEQLEPTVRAMHDEQNEFLVQRLRLTIDILRSEPGAQQRVDELFQRFGALLVDAEGTWMIQTALLAYQAGVLGDLVGSLQSMTTGPQARMWAAGLAVALWWSGDHAGAEEVLDRPDDLPRNYFWLAVQQALAEVAVGLGRHDHCRSLFDQLWEFRGRISVTGGGSSSFGLLSRTLGLLALELGNMDTAIELLTEAKEQADRLGARLDGVSARRSLATALRAAGRADGAGDLLAEAAAVAESQGFGREAMLIGEIQAQCR